MEYQERQGINVELLAYFLIVRLRHFPNQSCGCRIQGGTGEGEATTRIEREMSGKEIKLPHLKDFLNYECESYRPWILMPTHSCLLHLKT